jgi:hypothetical protein
LFYIAAVLKALPPADLGAQEEVREYVVRNFIRVGFFGLCPSLSSDSLKYCGQ